MPLVLLERVPLPSLRTYTSVSVGLLSLSVYYALQVSTSPNWRLNATENGDLDGADLSTYDSDTQVLPSLEQPNRTVTWMETLQDTAYTMVQEPFCIWVSTFIIILVKPTYNSQGVGVGWYPPTRSGWVFGHDGHYRFHHSPHRSTYVVTGNSSNKSS